jgi:hypothetical protein
LPLPVPAALRAEDNPEALLPASTQLYLRWDGVDAHALEYSKTALGKMMAGDTGKFINSVMTQLQDSLGGSLTADQLLAGASPEKLKKLQADAKEVPGLLKLVSGHGFILAAEVKNIDPPQVEVTIIVPGAGDKSSSLFAAFRLAAALSEVEVKESKYAGKAVGHIDAGPVQIAWWLDGKDAIIAAGTDAAEGLVKRRSAASNEAKITSNPLYKKVTAFKEFPTAARGYMDVPNMVKGLTSTSKDAQKLVADLGIDNIKSITFYSGFDGETDRGVVEMDAPEPRKGLLSLYAGKPFKVADLPPMPTDVTTWSMANFNSGATYDLTIKFVEEALELFQPNAVKEFKDGVEQIDKVIGVKLREDILANLDDKVAVYNSAAEGPLTLGQTFLFKVKNPEKLEANLDQAVKSLIKNTGVKATVHKHKYHDAEVHEISFQQQGVFFVPSWTIYKGWLAISYFPQAVQGYVLRSNGEVPAWKATPQVQASLEKLPSEFIAITYSDPTPSVRQLLALAPLVMGLINSTTKDIKLDVAAIPNAHEATKHLFPNVAVATDKNGVLRYESRSSLELPFDLTGIESYGLFFAFVAARGVK